MGLGHQVPCVRPSFASTVVYLLQAAHRVTHVEGEEEDDMPAMNLSKLVCLKTEDEKVRLRP